MALNLMQRINKVREAIAYVQKDDKKIDGQYKAVSHDMVTALVRPHFVTNGVIVLPKEVTSITVNTGKKTSKGTPVIRLETQYDVWFINMDEPTDRECVRLTAHGEDTGDKAPGKCHSYAVKYAILKILSLETGEDDEGRIDGSGGGAQMSPQRLADIYISIDEAENAKALTDAWQKGVAQAEEIGDHDARKDITDRASKRRGVLEAAKKKGAK